ncbi:MAG: hypothetical protein KA807_04075 [Prolixibacteraceae bacterium]|jgi:hypothetical protein|nr:hypothetical protein [Prolixibacteraceae bacterium]
MSKFLKGNYNLGNTMNVNTDNSETKEADFSKIFETKAFEKLGGSIAFVMKSNKFLWEEENAD